LPKSSIAILTPSALSLGPVERGVRIGEQRRRVAPVVGKNGDADAEACPNGEALDVQIALDGGEQSIGQFGNARGLVCDLGDEGELVAAEPGEKCVPGRREQSARDFAEQLISGGMPEDVVHFLETVEIDAEDGEALGRTDRPAQGRCEALVERGPVGKVGEGVVMGQMRDALFGAFALRDVVDHGQHELRNPVSVFQQLPVDGDDPRFPPAQRDGVVIDEELARR
jgi:hypothetical protein